MSERILAPRPRTSAIHVRLSTPEDFQLLKFSCSGIAIPICRPENSCELLNIRKINVDHNNNSDHEQTRLRSREDFYFIKIWPRLRLPFRMLQIALINIFHLKEKTTHISSSSCSAVIQPRTTTMTARLQADSARSERNRREGHSEASHEAPRLPDGHDQEHRHRQLERKHCSCQR